jgi:2-methylfumaryl-CoA hydratase
MRPAAGYFFEDYTLGQKFVHAVPRTITAGDVSLYQALTGSRNPLHCGEPFAQSLGYSSSPIDDLLVFHIAFGKTVVDISYNAVANLGYAECRFVQPVFVGDTLRAETEVIGLKANRSGKTGVVYVRSMCFNQRDEMVLAWVRWVMIHRAVDATDSPNANTSTGAAVGALPIPEFDRFVAPENLHAAFVHQSNHSVSAATGSNQFWDQIALNAPIKHPSGMTLDETDHTLATKLYQNNARVHFDLHHMKDSRFGRRLIYGGQVISICRALAFDGLENALTVAAINAGSHSNPTFAGDTLYAVSTPMMKWPLNNNLGALRVQLDGYKNIDPNTAEFANMSSEQKSSSLVLSLDLTVLMPRKI